MSTDNITAFNLLLTRAIAKLYENHPMAIVLGTADLWDPPLKATDPEFEKKKRVANGTLMWLHRNGIVDGDLQDFGNGDMLAISNALLTARGYQIANNPENNYNAKALGQVAVEAMANPVAAQSAIDWVAKRFTQG